MADGDLKEEVIRATKEMLGAIDRRDFDAYCKMTVPHLSAFEPETRGHLVEGLDFHKYYSDHYAVFDGPTTIVNPCVHLFGKDVACIAYVRLRQRMVGTEAETVRSEETRVLQKIDGHWKLIHLHRSKSS
ncbi:calcium/calmodulin-dependent protein kinase type II delta chain-like [Ptychodera flava]|uniref:calcium/calmodulin-dependent protein kinase type II delta chain-like n=1 Tax=Ptychodera flava TaxID=63121 RepID=UPI00396A10A0